MGCGCKKQPVIINPQPTPEVIEPITLTEEQINEYLNYKNGESETSSTGTDSE
jgi:hypothetical protein